MLNLNKIKQEWLADDLNRATRVTNKFYPQYLEAPQEVNFSEKIAKQSANLGYINYQQEQSGEAINFFQRSADAATAWFCHEALPEPGRSRQPWQFLQYFYIVIAFGSEKDQHSFSQVDENIYFYQEDAENKAFHQYVADVVAFFKDIVAGQPVSADRVQALIEASNQTKRNKDEQSFVVPVVNGMVALLQENKGAWCEAVQSCLDRHLKQVKSGDYRDDIEGFICMPGMALIKMGTAKGWKTDIDSLYLPLALLKESV